MRAKRLKHLKASWPKMSVKKWLNIKTAGQECNPISESTIIDDVVKRRNSSCGESCYVGVPEEFSEGWLTEKNYNKRPELEPDVPPLTDPHNLRVFVGTWNVGGKSPDNELNLSHWLRTTSPADIYVLGFQEIVPLNPRNVLLGSDDTGPSTKWLTLIGQALNTQSFDSQISIDATSAHGHHKQPNTRPRASFSDLISLGNELSQYDFFSFVSSHGTCYKLAASKQMVGLFLCVWVRSDLYHLITNVRVSCIARGFLGYLGGKGSISISFTLLQKTFCFVCAHLASGEKRGDEIRRNMDVMEILKKTKFSRSRRAQQKPILHKSILDHDNIIWLGDLNYRLESSYGDTYELLEKNDWQRLLEKDQLKIEQRAGRVFKGWEEGRIHFAPTYKYLINSDYYVVQTSTSKDEHRTPAWCDRILWRGEGLKQICYERSESKLSDHRPVYSLFSLQLNLLNQEFEEA